MGEVPKKSGAGEALTNLDRTVLMTDEAPPPRSDRATAAAVEEPPSRPSFDCTVDLRQVGELALGSPLPFEPAAAQDSALRSEGRRVAATPFDKPAQVTASPWAPHVRRELPLDACRSVPTPTPGLDRTVGLSNTVDLPAAAEPAVPLPPPSVPRTPEAAAPSEPQQAAPSEPERLGAPVEPAAPEPEEPAPSSTTKPSPPTVEVPAQPSAKEMVEAALAAAAEARERKRMEREARKTASLQAVKKG